MKICACVCACVRVPSLFRVISFVWVRRLPCHVCAQRYGKIHLHDGAHCVCICTYRALQVYQARQRIAKDRLATGTIHTVALRNLTATNLPWIHTLFSAVLNVHRESVRDYINLPGKLGFTALQLAAAMMDHEAMRIILQRGGDPRVAADTWQLTPLHFAARNCDVVAAGILIDAGARVGARSKLGELARDMIPRAPLLCQHQLHQMLDVEHRSVDEAATGASSAACRSAKEGAADALGSEACAAPSDDSSRVPLPSAHVAPSDDSSRVPLPSAHVAGLGAASAHGRYVVAASL